jgi:hypothetical protein
MSIYELGVTNGPSKVALQAAVSNARNHQHVSFDTEEGPLEAHLDACEEVGNNAPEVVMRGHVASGPYKGRAFVGTYDPATRQGSLNLAAAP